ncbi:MAG: DUF5062 family protein [Salinisphaera sp.]
MKKLKNEKELVKKAIALGVAYGEKRGAVEFEATDSATDKLEYIDRLLGHAGVIQPLPGDQVSQKSHPASAGDVGIEAMSTMDEAGLNKTWPRPLSRRRGDQWAEDTLRGSTAKFG